MTSTTSRSRSQTPAGKSSRSLSLDSARRTPNSTPRSVSHGSVQTPHEFHKLYVKACSASNVKPDQLVIASVNDSSFNCDADRHIRIAVNQMRKGSDAGGTVTKSRESNLLEEKTCTNFLKSLARCVAFSDCLITLELPGIPIPLKSVQLMGRALSHVETLTKLNLKQCRIGDEGFKALSEFLDTCTTLQELYLEGCNLGDDSGIRISSVVKSHTSRRQGEQWAASLRGEKPDNNIAGLTHVDLSHNKLTEKTALAFSSALLHDVFLKNLIFVGNSMGVEGVQQMSDMLEENETLEKLEIMDNGLTPAQEITLQSEINSKLERNKKQREIYELYPQATFTYSPKTSSSSRPTPSSLLSRRSRPLSASLSRRSISSTSKSLSASARKSSVTEHIPIRYSDPYGSKKKKSPSRKNRSSSRSKSEDDIVMSDDGGSSASEHELSRSKKKSPSKHASFSQREPLSSEALSRLEMLIQRSTIRKSREERGEIDEHSFPHPTSHQIMSTPQSKMTSAGHSPQRHSFDDSVLSPIRHTMPPRIEGGSVEDQLKRARESITILEDQLREEVQHRLRTESHLLESQAENMRLRKQCSDLQENLLEFQRDFGKLQKRVHADDSLARDRSDDITTAVVRVSELEDGKKQLLEEVYIHSTPQKTVASLPPRPSTSSHKKSSARYQALSDSVTKSTLVIASETRDPQQLQEELASLPLEDVRVPDDSHEQTTLVLDGKGDATLTSPIRQQPIEHHIPSIPVTEWGNPTAPAGSSADASDNERTGTYEMGFSEAILSISAAIQATIAEAAALANSGEDADDLLDDLQNMFIRLHAFVDAVERGESQKAVASQILAMSTFNKQDSLNRSGSQMHQRVRKLADDVARRLEHWLSHIVRRGGHVSW